MARSRRPRDGAATGAKLARAAAGAGRSGGAALAATDAPGAGRATLVLWWALAALAAARAALAFVPAMGGWALNLHRFLHPALAWLPWAVGAAALAPPLARRAVPWAERAGDALALGARGPALAALGAAALVLALPDQVRFTGDFLIRQGTIEEAIRPDRVWPQALPLDTWLHFRLPLELDRAFGLDPNLYGRLFGAAACAALAALAAAFARACGFRGGAALAASSAAFWGGTLALFTGYNKGLAGLAVLALAVAAAGVRVAREGRGFVPLGFALAAAVALHRSGPALLPAGAAAWALAARARPGAWRGAESLAGAAAVAASLVAFGPRIAGILTRYDPVHVAPAEVVAAGGPLAAALAPARLADTLNLALLLAPLAVAAPFAALAFGRDRPRGREALALAALALPAVAAFPFLRPIHGAYRDWDVFAPWGVGLAALTAWLAGHALRAAPARAWLAPAMAVALAVPAVQWVAHHTDVARGMARVEAFATEAPRRTPNERAYAWDFVGTRWNQLENHAASAEAFRRACEDAPSPRLLLQWALAEVLRGNPRGAIAAYHRHLEKDPKSLAGWLGLAAAASRVPDFAESRRALLEVLKLDPRNPDALAILPQLDESERRWREGGSVAVPFQLTVPEPPRVR
uniref:Tetratricopeptide repeat protein n=1 Tax=Eiseniibacteriota bacterium TaxID=2212470 RepID=A0A832I3U2_UNCEI